MWKSHTFALLLDVATPASDAAAVDVGVQVAGCFFLRLLWGAVASSGTRERYELVTR